MTDYLTEQEQIELLKNWVKQYSTVIITGIVIAIVFVMSYQYWQQRQAKVLSHASSVYDEMLTMRARNNPVDTFVQANKLFDHYSQTAYGQMAAFMLARDATMKKNFPEAEKQLNWILTHSDIPSLRQIARIRLGRILVATNQPEQGIKTLEKVDDKTFNGLTNEVRGDAYFAMHDIIKARDAYQKALAELPNAEAMRPLLQMKYDNLATLK